MKYPALSSVLGITTLVLASTAAFCGEKEITVAADGSGDHATLQEALAAVPDNSADATIIHIKPGTYQGHFIIPKSKANVTLVGDSAENTFL